MRIVRRNRALKYPRAICREKRQLVLDWLLEFRFSSFALLAQRLGLTCQSSYKFFRLLRKNGLVQRFTHDHYNHEQYYMLTRAGAVFLHEAGRDIANACPAPSRLIRYSYIMHDLAVQQAAIRRLDHYTEVISEHHITIPKPFHRPDMLMRNARGFGVAFEYERTRKQTKRIFNSFNNHARAIIKKHYHATYFLFDRESHRAYYQNLFDSPEWPEYKVNRQTGKIFTLYETFKPDTVTNLRKCFRFIHEPRRPAPALAARRRARLRAGILRS